jgi:DNA-binding Lrp family transcriptional regulator
MNEIAAPARIAAHEIDCRAAVTPWSTARRVLKLVVSVIIRRSEVDVAKRYQGSSWCDSIEHELNYDVITGRRARL